jgi:prepilin-type N-terminal cleavage/methylation domain-containing protein
MLRRGYSLIETLAVLTIGAVVVGISVGVLHMLMRTEQTGRDRVPQARVLARLAEQFRSDVAAAVRKTPGTRQGEWQFALTGDRVVTYRALPGEVRWDERTVGKLVRQESYVLPSGFSAAITVRSETTPAVASLVIAENGPPSAADREMRITAVLGKDHRFTKLPGGDQ